MNELEKAMMHLYPNGGWVVEGDAIIHLDDGLSKPSAKTIREAAASYDVTIQITLAELAVTPRRMRESLLTAEGKAWLQAKEEEISALREQL